MNLPHLLFLCLLDKKERKAKNNASLKKVSQNKTCMPSWIDERVAPCFSVQRKSKNLVTLDWRGVCTYERAAYPSPL